MDIKLNTANNNAVKLYLVGLSIKHKHFAPLKPEQANIISSTIKIPNNIKLDLPQNYSDTIIIKKKVLRGTYEIKDLTRIDCSKIDTSKAKKLAQEINTLVNTYQTKLDEFVTNLDQKSTEYSVYVIPGTGEIGESLGDIMVIGDSFEPVYGYAVILEELLHSIVKIPSKKVYELENIDDNLFAESYIGAVLYKLLNCLDYDKKATESVVFGWHNGARSQYVKNILSKSK